MNSAAQRILAIHGGFSSNQVRGVRNKQFARAVLDGKLKGVGRSEGVFAISGTPAGSGFALSAPTKNG